MATTSQRTSRSSHRTMDTIETIDQEPGTFHQLMTEWLRDGVPNTIFNDLMLVATGIKNPPRPRSEMLEEIAAALGAASAMIHGTAELLAFEEREH